MLKDFSQNPHFHRTATHARPVMVWRVGRDGTLKASWKMDAEEGETESNVIPFVGDGIFPFAGMQARTWHNRK